MKSYWNHSESFWKLKLPLKGSFRPRGDVRETSVFVSYARILDLLGFGRALCPKRVRWFWGVQGVFGQALEVSWKILLSLSDNESLAHHTTQFDMNVLDGLSKPHVHPDPWLSQPKESKSLSLIHI